MTTTDTNFTATGPASEGFLANGDFKTGVRAVGFLATDGIDLTVAGVIGSTGADPVTDKDGIGVQGRTRSGIGVSGVSSAVSQDVQHSCIGVSGHAVAGTGVEGESEQGSGVVGRGDPGVRGEGPTDKLEGVGVFGIGRVGVEGAGDLGVLGGPAEGPLFSGPPILTGVTGNAPGDVKHGDVPAAYGGWFDALNGTAPLHLEPSADDGPPPTALRGDFFVDNAGRLWFCVAPNTDSAAATWKQVQLV